MTAREPYTPPAAPEAVSTVDAALGSPSGEFQDGDGFSSVPLG